MPCWLLVITIVLAAPVRIAVAAEDAPPAGQPPAAPAAQAVDLFGGDLVAKGKDVAVKRSELDEAMVNIKSSAAARGQSIPPQQLEMLEQQMLDRLVQIQLLLAKANDSDRSTGKDLTAKRLALIKERARSLDDFDRQLKAMGTSQEKLQARMNEEATAQNVLERELKISVKDGEAKKFYDENPAQFEQPETVRASHILFATKDLTTRQDLSAEKKAAQQKAAQAVLKRARAGEDFAKLVKESSDDTGSKANGGEYTFARATADPEHAMAPEFEKAAFVLKPGEISDLVTTEYGYHIIKLIEKIPAKKLEFAKVAPDITEYLKQQQLRSRQQDYQAFIDKLKKDAAVAILDEKLKLQPVPESAAPPAAPQTK